ncbi:MAG TPA: T9SS type A sorting domain-containing protein, partial [Calditrichaeota bacterium]|nr:T9SS type A sorting domain-containing protein [Calditrichota bacterium]
FRNNICYKNKEKQLYLQSGDNTASHNLTDVDPLFVDPANGDFHLQSGSPAIDAGTETDAPNFDLDDLGRPHGTAFDMGAYEYGADTPAEKKYTLTVNMGSGSGSYDLYEFVNISAAPAPEGHKFDHWTGDTHTIEDSLSAQTVVIIPDKDITITAVYRIAMPSGGGSGSILREVWTGIRGTTISKLTGNSNYPDNPKYRFNDSAFKIPVNYGNNYGTRMRGYIHPPIDGEYVFWLASKNEGELWLSSDDTPDNADKICYVDAAGTAPFNWDDPIRTMQQSQPIALEAGKKYYIEALQKAGTDEEDNLAVCWLLQNSIYSREVIDSSYLSPWDLNSSIGPTNGAIPSRTWLEPAFPNPFNNSTSIPYTLQKKQHVRLVIYNRIGQLLSVLYDGFQSPGSYHIIWRNHSLSSGIYYCILKADNVVVNTQKLVLLK